MRYMPTIPGIADGDLDELFRQAVELVTQYDRMSAGLLQRRLSIGYARAARLIDQLEAAGIIGPADGSNPREVLMDSPDEILAKIKETPEATDEGNFAIPENYKVPSVKLSSSENSPWGKQFSEVFNSKDLKNPESEFSIPIGYDDEGKLQTDSLLNAGNFIVAGNTLSQKENFIDTVLLTYLLKYSPRDLRLVLHDPTHDLDLYQGIPHLLNPVITDYSMLIAAVKWSWSEVDRRLKLFSGAGVRNLDDYNKIDETNSLPHILFVCFYNFPDIETMDAIPMLAGLSMRSGVHLIVVVDRTTGKSLPTGFKSTIPARVVFRLSSAGESRAIDVSGAEKLEPGEIIYKPNYGSEAKLQAIFTPEINVKEVVQAVEKVL